MDPVQASVWVPRGYVGNLSSEQAHALACLRDELRAGSPNIDQALEETGSKGDGNQASKEKEELDLLAASEGGLLRFLRARDFEVEKAKAMAIASSRWRASVNPLSVHSEMLPTTLPSGFCRLGGFTRSGMPILILDAEKYKPSQYATMEEYNQYMGYFMELAISRMGKGVERIFLLCLCSAFNAEMMRPFAVKCGATTISVLQSMYPERLGMCMLCNAPTIFKRFFALMRPLLDTVTFAKFQFAEADAMKSLLPYIDPSQLPPSIGGAHAEPPLPTQPVAVEAAAFGNSIGGIDRLPEARDISALAGVVSETLICGSATRSYSGELPIRAGKSAAFEVALERNTKQVAWSFKLSAFDIAFSHHVSMPSDLRQDGAELLRPNPESGEDFARELEILPAWVGGTLHLTLDNSRSRIRSKAVAYTIRILAD